MKKMIALFLCAVMCLSFVACNSNLSPDNDTVPPNDDIMPPNDDTTLPDGDNSQDIPLGKDFSVDLDGYVANIGNATALGIAQKKSGGITPVMAKGGTELLSFIRLSSDKDSESKNYIVMSTTEYGDNTPEADKNGLTKVTFTKTITENVTTETTGTKYITATDGQITILAVTGFTYTIYENDTLLYEAVQDNDEIDTNNQEGAIVLTGLIDGVEYKVDYAGVGKEITITQDEIGGEIDKLYSAGAYTFISFVPEGTSERSHKNAVYDRNGIDMYDKTGYESHDTRQSFVIHNATGYVYALNEFRIDSIAYDIILSSKKYYDMTISESGELTFKQVVLNESLKVYKIFKDKYGNIFVENDKLETYDAENKTLYYKNEQYYMTLEGVAIYVIPEYPEQMESGFTRGVPPENFKEIKKVGENFELHEIEDDEEYTLDTPHAGNTYHNIGLKNYFATILKIKDGYFYYTSAVRCGSTRVKLSSMECEYIQLDTQENCAHSVAYDYNSEIIVMDNNLYYGNIWGDNSFTKDGKSALTLLLQNVTVDFSTSYYYDDAQYIQTTLTGTNYYKIILDENGNPLAINIETYIAPDREVVTLQPINK